MDYYESDSYSQSMSGGTPNTPVDMSDFLGSSFRTRFEMLSSCYLRDEAQLTNLFTGTYKTLFVLGNMIHGDDKWLLIDFFDAASTIYDHIYYVPGEYEFMSSKFTIPEILDSMKKLARTYTKTKITIMNNNMVIDHDHQIIIFGSPFWYHISQPYTTQYTSNIKIGDGIMTAVKHNMLHYKCVQEFEKATAYATRYRYQLMVLTSYSPERVIHEQGTYIHSDWDIFVKKPCIWLWLMGGKPIIEYLHT